MPRNELSGRLNTVAGFNPVTCLLAGLRTLDRSAPLQWTAIGPAAVAVGVVGAISMTLCFAALGGRVKRG